MSDKIDVNKRSLDAFLASLAKTIYEVDKLTNSDFQTIFFDRLSHFIRRSYKISPEEILDVNEIKELEKLHDRLRFRTEDLFQASSRG